MALGNPGNNLMQIIAVHVSDVGLFGLVYSNDG